MKDERSISLGLNRARRTFFILSFLIVVNACSLRPDIPISSDIHDESTYQNAILDAMVADKAEISEELIPIIESNNYLTWDGPPGDRKLLVVTWTQHPERYEVGDTLTTQNADIWVTVVPEVKDWFRRNHVHDVNHILRLKQLLGLPPHAKHTHFIEIWVSPEFLFRPAPDNDITDSVVGLNFPDNTETWYIKWFSENRKQSYSEMQFPWTRLGYTYDWGNSETEIGVSEFVIKSSAEFIVKSKESTLTYINYGE